MAKSKERHVIVRTYSAGVHYGTLVDRRGKEVDLANAKRIWSWSGANTLHEIALRGVGSGSRISDAVDRITVTEAIEIIDCSDAAVENLEAAKW
jgi:hypothetical protein